MQGVGGGTASGRLPGAPAERRGLRSVRIKRGIVVRAGQVADQAPLTRTESKSRTTPAWFKSAAMTCQQRVQSFQSWRAPVCRKMCASRHQCATTAPCQPVRDGQAVSRPLRGGADSGCGITAPQLRKTGGTGEQAAARAWPTQEAYRRRTGLGAPCAGPAHRFTLQAARTGPSGVVVNQHASASIFPQEMAFAKSVATRAA